MTHDQLAAFVAVATEGTFTLAARRLHKSQSAVSKLVRNLEDELGVELFDRSEYRATPSAAGSALLEHAIGALERVRELATLGRALAGAHEPVVRLGIDAITPLDAVLAVLRAVGKKYPAVRLELSTEHMGGAVEALEERRVELAITSRGSLDPRRVEAEPFGQVAIVAVAHRDHPVAQAAEPVPPALLRAHPQIVLSDSARRTFSPSINVLDGGLRWNVSDLAAKRQIILAGMGWGGLPRHLIASDLRRGTLVELGVREFHADSIALFLVRRRDRSAGVVAEALWAGLLGAARESSTPHRLERARSRAKKQGASAGGRRASTRR